MYIMIFFFSDEELLKWGFPEDVWYVLYVLKKYLGLVTCLIFVVLLPRFHVDKMSSAHVYLRRPKVHVAMETFCDLQFNKMSFIQFSTLIIMYIKIRYTDV